MHRPEGLDLWMYLRKSRKDIEEERKAIEEGKPYDVLEKHRKRLLEVARTEKHNIIDILPEVASSEFISERPEIQKILREIEAGHGDGILVMDVDRIGRGDMVDQGIIYRIFQQAEKIIVTPSDVIDPSEEGQELNYSVRAMVAREELNKTKKRFWNGRQSSAKEGKSISNRPPFGYLRDDDLKLYPDPETSWVVVKIFEMLEDGYGRQQVADYVDNLPGIEPAYTDHWGASTIKSILQNEVYLGHLIWGRQKNIKVNGKYRIKKLPREQWTIKKNAHEAIISQELFDAANEASTQRYKTPMSDDTSLKNPFAGILFCANCGKAMKYFTLKKRNDRLQCRQSQCKRKQRSVLFHEVEKAMLRALRDTIDTYESDAKPVVKESLIPGKETAAKAKRKELVELDKQKDSLHDFLEKGIYGPDTFLERQNVIAGRMKDVKETLSTLEKEIEEEKEREKQQHEYVPKLKNVLEAYHQTTDIEKKNRLMKSVIEKATFRRDINWVVKDQFEIQLYPKI
jgi:site-specific DNA recombinase